MMRRVGMAGMIVALLLATPGVGWTQIPPWELYRREQENRRQPAEWERPQQKMNTQRPRDERQQVEQPNPQRLEERQKDERLQERQP